MRGVSALGLLLGLAACGSGDPGVAADGGIDASAPADAAREPDAGPQIDCTGEASGWAALGDPLSAMDGATDAFEPRIAIAPLDGEPVVVWRETDADGNRFAFVGRWTGSAWATLGKGITAVPETPRVIRSDVAFSGGELVVAFGEPEGSETFVHAVRWSGSAWEPLGDRVSDLDLTSSGRLDVELRADGTPLVAFASEEIHVFEWTGAAWEEIGAGMTAEGLTALSPDLEIASDGTPIVSWQQSGGHIRAWDGEAWGEIAGGSFQANEGASPFAVNLELDTGDVPVIAWAEFSSDADPSATGTYVGRAEEGAVITLAGPLSDDPGDGTNAVPGGFGLDSAGRGTVSFGEATGEFEGVSKVRVYQDLGGGYAPLAGGVLDAVAGDTHAGFRPTLAVDPCDRPVVAWQEEDGPDGTWDVHVWRHQD